MLSTKEVIKQVRKIEISTKNLVDTLIAGNYHSIFKGQGIEFAEIREYIEGDDIRNIDWNVTARFNKPHVKEFIEERDLRIYIMFDISGSGNFGNNTSKKHKGIELAATLMFSALRNNDNVSLLLFSDKIEKYIPPRKGKKHILQLLSNLINHQTKSNKTNIAKSIKEATQLIKKRSVIFIVSDFLSEDFSKELKILKSRHDVIVVDILDIRELEIPDVGLIELEDEETGEQLLVDTSDEEFRINYIKEVEKSRNKLKNIFKKLKIDTIHLNTDDNYEIPLKRFFMMRKRRR